MSENVDRNELVRDIELMRQSLAELDPQELIKSLVRERDSLRDALAVVRGHRH
jgi:hypothetical protein